MKIKTAKFLLSAEKLSQCPNFNLPEFALLGRSNVGKSSFINAITNNGKLAKTSNTPGKTRLINFFNINDKFIIADLPGYGYAKVSQETQAKWQRNLEEYLKKRNSIVCLFQFIDSRHEVQKNDLQMNEWLKINNLPTIAIATKIDYVPKNKIQAKLSEIEKSLKTKVIPFSSKIKTYNEQIFQELEDLISTF